MDCGLDAEIRHRKSDVLKNGGWEKRSKGNALGVGEGGSD